MFLSRLVLNGRHPRALRALAEADLMHQLVYSGFPDREDGGPGRVLFRAEGARAGRPGLVLVQSEKRPAWERLLEEGVVLSAECKALQLRLAPGQRLRFRLRANPTVRRVFQPAQDGRPKQSGRRIGVYGEDAQRAWLCRKADSSGFRVLECAVSDRGIQFSRRRNGAAPLRHLCVDFEGIIEVTDAERFVSALERGIGSAKAFGFGLLSVAPSR